MKSEKRHLHFFAIFSECIAAFRYFILPIVMGLLAGRSHLSDLFGYWLIIPFVIAAFGCFKWLRLTYEITDGRFHLQSGVLVRNDRYIQLSRIQSVQIQTNVLFQVFGLVKLKLDIADRAGKSDLVLSVLKLQEAERIKTLLGHSAEAATQTADETDMPVAKSAPERIFRLSGRDLLAAAMTSSSIGIVGVLLVLWSHADHLVPENFLQSSFSSFRRLPPASLIVFIFSAIAVLWLISLAITFIRWGNFRLTVTEGQWQVHKGILETSDETYKTDRVQAIRIKEQLLQQLFGLCTVYAECSGSVDSEKGAKGSVLVFPVIRKKGLQHFLETIIPQFAGPIACRRIPLRGNLYALIKTLLVLSVVFTGLSWFLGWGKWFWLVLPVAAIWYYYQFRSSGFRLEGKRIVFTHRLVTKTSVITLKKHVQTFTWKNSRIQQQLGLCSCRVSVRSSLPQSYEVHQLEKKDAEVLFQWFRT